MTTMAVVLTMTSILLLGCFRYETQAFSPITIPRSSHTWTTLSSSNNNNDDDFIFDDDDEDAKLFGALSSTPSSSSSNTEDGVSSDFRDFSGGTTRQFALGYDITLASFAGSMGFDEVVDWEYYDDQNKVLDQQPRLDPTKPNRTRKSSGGVLRIFRGELVGRVAGTLRSQGRDVRVLVKEFSGEPAVPLAEAELKSVGKLQSEVLCNSSGGGSNGEDDDEQCYDWSETASSRYLLGQDKGDTREDDVNLMKLMGALSSSSNFVGILGLLNLSTYLNDETIDPNEWYRALGVTPPKPDSVWIVYEYAGLSTLANYCRPPPLVRHAQIRPQRGFFGNVVPPPPLPDWDRRASYVVQGILQQLLQAVATMHDNGIAHRSIGRHSVVLSTTPKALNKSAAADVYAVNVRELTVKLSDFGFAGTVADCAKDEAFVQRARAFGIGKKKDDDDDYDDYGRSSSSSGSSISLAQTNFCMAEDLHALGFVFVGVLLTTLAEFPLDNDDYTPPDTDEDSLQRLLGDIFEKDMSEFREYCAAEDIWTKVVALLDQHDGAGWDLLEKLCFARERAGENKNVLQLSTARGLLSNRLFTG